MIGQEMEKYLQKLIREGETPREKAVDVMYILQKHYGYLSDQALEEGARLLGMTPLELEELATFYDFIYRRPVGRYVIHICDSLVCWMFHKNHIFTYICQKLGVNPGEVSSDGLFTVLPTCCIGDCHNAPSIHINGKFYGSLTPQKVDRILEDLRRQTKETDPSGKK